MRSATSRARGVPRSTRTGFARGSPSQGPVDLVSSGCSGWKSLPRTAQLDRCSGLVSRYAGRHARKRLNAIVHPLIASRTAQRASELAALGEPLGCYEAALLVENGVADAFRPLVVVACPEEVQIERLATRGRRLERRGAERASGHKRPWQRKSRSRISSSTRPDRWKIRFGRLTPSASRPLPPRSAWAAPGLHPPVHDERA